MTVTTFSSREFNQDTSQAKRAAVQGPVYITDRGLPAHVLLTYEDYEKLVGKGATIVDLLGRTEGAATADLVLLDRGDTARAADLG